MEEKHEKFGILKLLFKMYGPSNDLAAKGYIALAKALEDDEPFQAQIREMKRQKELNKARLREWCQETGIMKRMEEHNAYAKLHPDEPRPTMKDIYRECKAIKPYPEMLGDEDWQKEIDRLQQQEE